MGGGGGGGGATGGEEEGRGRLLVASDFLVAR